MNDSELYGNVYTHIVFVCYDKQVWVAGWHKIRHMTVSPEDREVYKIFPNVVTLDTLHTWKDETQDLWVVPASPFARRLMSFLPWKCPLPEPLQKLTGEEMGMVTTVPSIKGSTTEEVSEAWIKRVKHDFEYDNPEKNIPDKSEVEFTIDKTLIFIDMRERAESEMRNV